MQYRRQVSAIKTHYTGEPVTLISKPSGLESQGHIRSGVATSRTTTSYHLAPKLPADLGFEPLTLSVIDAQST